MAQGGTGATNATAARAGLGVAGVPVPVAQGGTASTTAAAARTALGVPAIPVPINQGGTGATSAANARSGLGIASDTGTLLVGGWRARWGEMTLTSGNNVDFAGSTTFPTAFSATPWMAIAVGKEVGGTDPRLLGSVVASVSTTGLNLTARNNVGGAFSSVGVFWFVIGPA